MSRRQSLTFQRAVNALGARLASGKPPPKDTPTHLPFGVIRENPDVFQQRRPRKHTSEAHIKELTKAPQQGRKLTPITVWWDGKGWVCLDGHHRIAAYRKANWSQHQVPVNVFSGSLENAIARAARANTRDKLPMSRYEKLDAAWRLTVGTQLPRSTVSEATGASERTVSHMRDVRRKLLSKAPDRDLSELFWEAARQESAGVSTEEVDWQSRIEEQANVFADLLSRHIGPRGRGNQEAFAMALALYDPCLPAFLAEFWADTFEAADETRSHLEQFEEAHRQAEASQPPQGVQP